MGVIAGAVYFVVMFLFIPVPFASWFAMRELETDGDRRNALELGQGIVLPGDFPLDKVRQGSGTAVRAPLI